MSRSLATLRRAVLSERSAAALARYARESERPLTALLFLLPGVLLYEGWALYARAGGGGRAPLAHSALRNLLEWFGIVGFWVPGVVLVITLLVLHRRRRERWRVQGWVLPLMVVESVLLAIPLRVVAGLFAQARTFGAGGTWERVMGALGAGIYEELVFRLLLIAGLLWVLRELVEMRGRPALWGAVLVAGLLFAMCHFAPIGSDAFRWTSFWFRFVAGVYLGLVYVGRGIGSAAGAHAVFNVGLVLG